MEYLRMEELNIPINETICFTGSRPKKLFGYDKDKYIPLVDSLTNKLEDLYKAGYRYFISGGAQGFDQLAFWSVNRLKKTHLDIKNIVFVPFTNYGEKSKWLDNGLFGKNEYKLMLRLADIVVICNPSLDAGNPSQSRFINNALFKRNHYMVDKASLVLGLWGFDDIDWKCEFTKGGTAECLRYALECNRKIHQLNPFTLDYEVVN